MTHPPTLTTAGHLVVQCLIAQGVDTVFGVPGESYLPVLDGILAHGDRIRFIACRHEGGAAFMAEAHGKLTGRPGVCMVTRGPGACNAAIGLHTAWQDATPLVMLVGDVGTDFRHREAFQELDFAAMFGPNTGGLAKRVERIDDVNRIPEAIARAFATAAQGRPGPVVLVLPEDVLRQNAETRPLPRASAVRSGCDPEALRSVQALLHQAQRPLVIVGPLASVRAAQALQRFAEQWHLPVANDFRCQDSFDNHHPLYAGDAGIGINPKLARRIKAADLVVAVGARLGEMTTGGYVLIESPQPQQQLVQFYPQGEELHRVYQATVALQADAESAALALESLAPPAQVPWQAWAAEAHADYLANLEPQALIGLREPADQAFDLPRMVATAQRLLPPDAVLANGAGNFSGWLHRYFRYHGWAKGCKTQLAPASGAMGYGIPAGIAANLTTGRVCFTITGDGDFLMNGQELATAAQYGARSIVLLLNNGSYGTIRMHQEREFPNRVSGSDLRNPDFCLLARAYGYHAERLASSDDFEAALRAALAREQGTLLEVCISPDLITTRSTLSAITRDALQQQALW